MPSSREYKDFILESLKDLDDITYKPMMGEFLLFYKKVIFGGIYDNRFLIKKTATNLKYALREETPYPKGKPMYMVENIDDQQYLKTLIEETVEGI